MTTTNPVIQFQYINITIYNTGHYCIYNPAGNNSIPVISSNIPQYHQFFNTLFHMLYKFIFKNSFYISFTRQYCFIMTIETTRYNRLKKAMQSIALIKHTIPGACPRLYCLTCLLTFLLLHLYILQSLHKFFSLLLKSWLAKECKHILFIAFNTRLVKWINSKYITTDATCKLIEIE